MFQTLIPLADLNTELQLSNQSLDVFPKRIVRSRYSSSDSINAIFETHYNATSSSLHSSLNDVHLLPSAFSFEDSYERDCNVTELTYENSELDMDSYKAYLEHRLLNNSCNNDSGSDSGICDPANSDKGGSRATQTPSKSPISANNSGGKNSPVSDDSGSFCEFTPLFKDVTSSNVMSVHLTSSGAPSPVNILSSAPTTRSSSLRRSGVKRIDPVIIKIISLPQVQAL